MRMRAYSNLVLRSLKLRPKYALSRTSALAGWPALTRTDFAGVYLKPRISFSFSDNAKSNCSVRPYETKTSNTPQIHPHNGCRGCACNKVNRKIYFEFPQNRGFGETQTYIRLPNLPSMPFLMAWLKSFPNPMSAYVPFSESRNILRNLPFSTVREKNGETQMFL